MKSHLRFKKIKEEGGELHNPHNLPPEVVDPYREGYRLLTKDEVAFTGETAATLREIERWSNGAWDCTGWLGSDISITYRTRYHPRVIQALRRARKGPHGRGMK